jgi:RimJ/RimL family protein N-acetyltransferase
VDLTSFGSGHRRRVRSLVYAILGWLNVRVATNLAAMTSATHCSTPCRPVSLVTERLRLTVPTLDDFEEMSLMWSDMEVVAQVIGRPLTEEEVWARLHRIAGHWALLGFGHWIVRERHSGKFVGELGFFRFKRNLGADFDGAHEMGWMFSRKSQGQGYATEAAAAALTWLERERHSMETVCLIPPDNLASLALADKLSYAIQREVVYRDKAMLVLRRDARKVRRSLA